jgi:hypothetical protein
MSEPLRICRGFDLMGYHVPPFDVRPGEAITLQLPVRIGLESQLKDVLTGKDSRPELEAVGRCRFAAPADPPTGWRRWFNDPLPLAWLHRYGLSDEAEAVLGRLRIDRQLPMSQLAGIPRALLGLEAAYQLGADVIVFHTHGLDPLGVAAVHELVRSRQDRTAAIYLSSRVRSLGHEGFRVFPGSSVVEVVGRPPVAVS